MSVNIFELVALAYEALGKLKSLSIAARKRGLGDDVVHRVWDEIGRLQIWAHYLGSKVDRWTVPPHPADTGKLVLTDLHEILDGAISIVSTLEDGLRIDPSAFEDDSETASIHDILQDIAEVINEVCALDLVYYNLPTCDGVVVSDQTKGNGDPSKWAKRAPSIIASTIDSIMDNDDAFSILSDEEGTIASTAPSKSSHGHTRSGLAHNQDKVSKRGPMESDITEEPPQLSEIDTRTEEQKSVAASRLMSWLNTDQPLGDPASTYEPDLETRFESQRASHSAINISADLGTDSAPQLISLFESIDTKGLGYVTEKELGRAFVNADYSSFDSRTVSLLFAMFYKSGQPGIKFDEFQGLWGYLEAWRSLFNRFNPSGDENLTREEFCEALKAFGYRLSSGFTDSYYTMFSRARRSEMPFDLFVQACVRLKAMTDWFKVWDDDRDGYITLSFEEALAGKVFSTRDN